MNDHNHFALIDELFREACQLAGKERQQFLDERCASDPTLRKEVQSLLEIDGAESGPLDAPPAFASSLIANARSAPQVEVELPRRIGGYRIIRRIGAGGMGTVFEAEQENPRRLVALKVISPGLVSRSMLKRFQFETDMLARLQHPGIAQIYAAGTFDAGAGEQPYFAMELVEGTPLLQYASKHKLTPRQRLELLAKLCDAVQHAHQRGVIHRDLKPANMLVTENGQPKILDFGVARATDRDTQVTTLQTNVGQIIGTVPYMSPEQAAGDASSVDTRSDVYSLGVLGYELLTGRLPFEVREKMLHEALRSIREDDPTPLTAHSKTLAGDVATIINKSIAKDRDRRYESAAALADDIRRYLDDEPIEARPPSVVYQIRKFTRRHRALTASLFVVIVALMLLSVGAIYAAAREHGLRQRAEAEIKVASGINEFLRMDVLAAADPGRAENADVTILEVLDQAADRIATRFQDQPEVHAAIRQTLADSYVTLGKLDVADEHLEAAKRILADVPADERHAELNLDATEARLRVAQGRYDEAADLMRHVVDDAIERLGPNDPEVLQYERDLAATLWNAGKFDDSVTMLERVLALEQASPDEQIASLETMNSLGIVYGERGEYDKSEAMFSSALEQRRELLGEDNWDTINTLIGYGQLLTEMQRNDEAEALMMDAIDRMKKRGTSDEHPVMLTLMNNLALLYLYTQKPQEAKAIYEDILETGARVEGPEHPNTLTTMHNLASAYMLMGDYPKARDMLTDTLARRRTALGENHPDSLTTEGLLGRAHLYLHDYEMAVEFLEDTYRRMRYESDLGADHPLTLRTAQGVAEAYEAWGKPSEAASWQAIADGSDDEPPQSVTGDE